MVSMMEQCESAHNVMLQRAGDLITEMLVDPFLSDLPQDCSFEDARSQLSLLEGKSVTVHVNKLDGRTICKQN